MGCTTFTNGPPEDVRGFAAPQPRQMNFRHLLVPSDGSVLAAAALPIVRVMATTLGAELTVAMVLPPDAQPGWTRGPADYLQEIAAPLRGAGVAVRANAGPEHRTVD
jgi:nucleotide-binding universal stress UspA family protein